MFLLLGLLIVNIEQTICKLNQLDDNNSTIPNDQSNDKGNFYIIDIENLLRLGNLYGPLVISSIGLLLSLIAIIIVIRIKRQVRKSVKRVRNEKHELKQLKNLSTISEIGYGADEFDQI